MALVELAGTIGVQEIDQPEKLRQIAHRSLEVLQGECSGIWLFDRVSQCYNCILIVGEESTATEKTR